MRIAFMMDPLAPIDPIWETTSWLMYEANQRGHSVFFLEPHDVYVRGSKLVARMHDVTVEKGLEMPAYWQAVTACACKEGLVFEDIEQLDVLFLRKDPPLIYQTMEFLNPVSSKVFIINNTLGQVAGNSKLYLLNFPDIIPQTHISRDPVRLRKVIDDFGGDMVVKPLQRSKGEGVIKVSLKDRDNLSSLIHYYVNSSKPYPMRESILVQEYLSEVKQKGDVRILLLNGEILGAMRRIPAEGDFRTNVHAGASAVKHEITDSDRFICENIKDKLVRDGLYFVGIDIIGDKLVEINCVSPGGIPRINLLDQVKLESAVMSFLEEKSMELKRGVL